MDIKWRNINLNKVIRFFRYLGFSDTSINAEQLLALICLLNEEEPTTLKGITIEQILNEVLDIYIEKKMAQSLTMKRPLKKLDKLDK